MVTGHVADHIGAEIRVYSVANTDLATANFLASKVLAVSEIIENEPPQRATPASESATYRSPCPNRS
jgi:hypothetical protein